MTFEDHCEYAYDIVFPNQDYLIDVREEFPDWMLRGLEEPEIKDRKYSDSKK